MKKIIAMVLALVFSVSLMAFAAETKVADKKLADTTAVTTTAKAKVKKHKGKKAVKPAATPVATVTK